MAVTLGPAEETGRRAVVRPIEAILRLAAKLMLSERQISNLVGPGTPPKRAAHGATGLS
jgi:hypothetical protein